MPVLKTQVDPLWVDYNGHMNDADYARVFSLSVDALMEQIGLDAVGRERLAYTLYTLETHLCYRKELHQGDAIEVQATLLDRDSKRLHLFFELHGPAGCAATSEQMLMGIDTESGRPAPFPEAVVSCIAELAQVPADAWPDAVGRRIAIRR